MSITTSHIYRQNLNSLNLTWSLLSYFFPSSKKGLYALKTQGKHENVLIFSLLCICISTHGHTAVVSEVRMLDPQSLWGLGSKVNYSCLTSNCSVTTCRYTYIQFGVCIGIILADVCDIQQLFLTSVNSLHTWNYLQVKPGKVAKHVAIRLLQGSHRQV